MSEASPPTPAPAANPALGTAENLEFAIQKLFVKDLSFESPGAPDIFLKEWKGETNLQLNTQARALSESEGLFEVELSVTVTTRSQGQTAYLVEVKQAGVFVARGFPPEQRAHLLGAYCPNLLFPFVREVVSDLVLKGGFPQLLLQPINFDALFLQHHKEQRNAAAAAAPVSA